MFQSRKLYKDYAVRRCQWSSIGRVSGEACKKARSVGCDDDGFSSGMISDHGNGAHRDKCRMFAALVETRH